MDTTLSDPLVGRVLGDRYRVEAHLARGGMAVVYRARDLRLDRAVAVKVMHHWLAQDSEFVSRFIREARSAARLSHPNVVAVYDQGTDGAHVYLAMEYVPGRTLRDLLAERGPLTPREAFGICDPVLAALSAAHAAGYVHRDVKPENVLLSDDGLVKVADFGLARTATAPTVVTRGTGVLMGTVAYLSPEQVQRGVADARSDVYAAGVLLYELLTGRAPFDGETALAVAYQHVHSDVPAPSARVAGLPAAVDELVAHATRRDPDQRPANAAELRGELARARASLSPEQLDSGGPDAVVPTSAARPAGTARPHDTPPGDALPGHGARPHHTLVVPALPATEEEPDEGTPSADGDGVRRAGRRRASKAGGAAWWRSGQAALVGVLVAALLVGLGAWWLGSGRYTETPGLVGLSKSEALARLQDAGLEMYVTDTARYSETVPEGHVVATEPSAGERVNRLGGVEVVLSKGKERYAVPEVVGVSLSSAERLLESRHLAVGGVRQRYSTEVDRDHVISVRPEPGTMVKRDTPVRLLVSKGPPPVEVPDVRGRSKDEAAVTLQATGLVAEFVERHSAEVGAGYVVTTRPGPGATVNLGSAVRVVVSKGPKLYPVPDVVGKSVAEATAILQQAGFTVNAQGFQDGTVRAQGPAAGEQHPHGTTVTIIAF